MALVRIGASGSDAACALLTSAAPTTAAPDPMRNCRRVIIWILLIVSQCPASAGFGAMPPEAPGAAAHRPVGGPLNAA